MRVLVLNCGSSSLKFDVVAAPATDTGAWQVIAHGIVDRFGKGGRVRLEAGREMRVSRAFEADGAAAAARGVLDLLHEVRLLEGLSAVGHRVVHGGASFPGPALIDGRVVAEIESLSRLAPLHNGPALEAIRVAQPRLNRIPHVAVFDTSFYSGLPDHVAEYALPRAVTQRHGIRRYGFHGLAHRAMIEAYRRLTPDLPDPRLITLQLGSGCSATASRGGVPVETSMGFTPLEGLIMGTRSGDLDPALPLFLAREERLTLDEVEELLNRRSGLLGLSGVSNDMRDLEQAAAQGDPGARLAIDAFCHRVRKYVGAYLAVLGGADAVIVGGGIGQHSALVRSGILHGFEWAAIALDEGRNAEPQLTEARISADTSAVAVWVIDVDEASIIAHDVYQCLAA